MRKNIFVLFVLTTFLFVSCGDFNPVDATVGKVTDAFDEAINNIVNQSISWQNTLQILEDKIKDDVTEVIREDLTYFVETSVATTGVELRCNGDYFRDALQREIRRLKNKYLASIGLASYEVPYLPNVCHVIPNPITPSMTNVQIYGYDLLKGYINAYLELKDGSRSLINQYVTFQSHYQMTILLGGANGLPFSSNNHKISIECETCDIEHKYVSEVGFDIPVVQQTLTGVVGGGGGGGFIDAPIQSEVKRVSGFRWRAGDKLDGVSVQWEKYNGEKVWSPWRGGNGGGYGEFFLDPDEEWIGIIGRAGTKIDQLGFITNKRTIGPFGGGGGGAFSILNVGQVVGIQGRSGQYIDAIGLVIRN